MRRENINRIKLLIEEMRKGKKPAPKAVKKEEPKVEELEVEEVQPEEILKRKKKIVKNEED